MMDGYIVYQGDAKESPSYFAGLGEICPNHTNPADFYMRILAISYPRDPEDKRVKKFVQHYEETI